MKKVAYTSFANNASKVVVESTGLKDFWGKAVWADENGNVYEVKYAKFLKRFAAIARGITVTEGVEKGFFK